MPFCRIVLLASLEKRKNCSKCLACETQRSLASASFRITFQKIVKLFIRANCQVHIDMNLLMLRLNNDSRYRKVFNCFVGFFKMKSIFSHGLINFSNGKCLYVDIHIHQRKVKWLDKSLATVTKILFLSESFITSNKSTTLHDRKFIKGFLKFSLTN